MRRLAPFLASLAVAAAATAQEPVVLREGIVIDPQAAVAYVMSVDRGVVAVELGTGAVRWRSDLAAKPLAVVQDLVISQVEPAKPASASTLVVAGLDVRDGTRKTDAATDLLQPVRVSAGEGRDGTFSVSALPSDGDAIVTWSFTPSPRRRMQARPEPRATPAGASPPSGVLRFELDEKKLSRVAGMTFDAVAKPDKRWLLFTERKAVSEPGGRWYASADGRHALKSERIGASTDWEKYRWVVSERETGKPIGEMRSHISFTPFVVHDSTIVFETTPYAHAGREEPAKLRGVSLATGKQAWEVPVREIVWRGPMPP